MLGGTKNIAVILIGTAIIIGAELRRARLISCYRRDGGYSGSADRSFLINYLSSTSTSFQGPRHLYES